MGLFFVKNRLLGMIECETAIGEVLRQQLRKVFDIRQSNRWHAG
jgi:hypothetical protein